MAQALTVNDKAYDIDDLSDEAKGLVNNIRYAEAKLVELQRESAVIQTARNAYTQALTAIVEKPEEEAEKAEE